MAASFQEVMTQKLIGALFLLRCRIDGLVARMPKMLSLPKGITNAAGMAVDVLVMASIVVFDPIEISEAERGRGRADENQMHFSFFRANANVPESCAWMKQKMRWQCERAALTLTIYKDEKGIAISTIFDHFGHGRRPF